MKRLIKVTLLIALVAIAYFQLLPNIYHRDSFLNDKPVSENFSLRETAENALQFLDKYLPDQNMDQVSIYSESIIDNTNSKEAVSTGNSRITIFGRVTDEDNFAIDDVLISEQRNFISARSGNDGKYQFSIERPENQTGTLHFLRSGYADKEIDLKAEFLQDASIFELNVRLENDFNTITASGWIANESGIGLSGMKIRLTSKDIHGLDQILSTAISDMNGFFSFEGVKSGALYRLTVFATENYPHYANERFSVTAESAQTNITLESFKFVHIDGMIVNSDDISIPDFEIYVDNQTTGTHVEKIKSDSSGFFSLQKFPAGVVSLITPGPDYIKITGLKLKEGEYKNLKLLVDKGSHYLSGWVSDENGMPLAQIRITLDSKIITGAVESSSYRARQTDSNGNFTFANIGGGVHRLSVDAYGFKRKEIVHEFDSLTDQVYITLSRKR